MVDLLSKRPDNYWAQEALVEMHDVRSIQPIASSLRNARLPNGDRCTCARFLGRIGGPAATTALASCLADRDGAIRESVAKALAEVGSEDALDALITYAKSAETHDTNILSSIAEFEMERATDFLDEHGQFFQSKRFSGAKRTRKAKIVVSKQRVLDYTLAE